jgi:WD40 repeat protein
MSVRSSINELDTTVTENRDSKQWIEAMSYSPCGKYLAVGSHDNRIRVYNVESGYSLHGTCSQHNSFITSVDWSQDSTQLRSTCGAHELLFFNVEDCSQNKSGASGNKGTDWANNTTKYSWSVEGVIPSGCDGTHINGVEWSHDKTLIATGDDWGLVNVFRNPARCGHKPKTLRGHSEHVVRVRFSDDDTYLYSIGGYDQTVMQWKKC